MVRFISWEWDGILRGVPIQTHTRVQPLPFCIIAKGAIIENILYLFFCCCLWVQCTFLFLFFYSVSHHHSGYEFCLLIYYSDKLLDVTQKNINIPVNAMRCEKQKTTISWINFPKLHYAFRGVWHLNSQARWAKRIFSRRYVLTLADLELNDSGEFMLN